VLLIPQARETYETVERSGLQSPLSSVTYLFPSSPPSPLSYVDRTLQAMLRRAHHSVTWPLGPAQRLTTPFWRSKCEYKNEKIQLCSYCHRQRALDSTVTAVTMTRVLMTTVTTSIFFFFCVQYYDIRQRCVVPGICYDTSALDTFFLPPQHPPCPGHTLGTSPSRRAARWWGACSREAT